MNIGIYGGSFNPVHFGHIGLAQWVVEHTDLDAVWMMVTPNNPIKPASMLADEQERLAAVRQAVADIPGVEACDFEFSLPRPSYTANTLRELQQAYPEHQFALIIGEDNLEIFDRWREHDWIIEHFPIYVYPRHTENTGVLRGSYGGLTGVIYLEGAPYFDISSTEIREKTKKMQNNLHN